MRLLVKVREVEFWEDEKQESPCRNFLVKLKDVVAKAKLFARIERASKGNFGDYKHLKAGLFELKETHGPGYRVYFCIDSADRIVVLLLAGDKGSQGRDIKKALEYLSNFRIKENAR